MNNQIVGAWYRFTLLGERFLRLEYDPDGKFEDRPSQIILERSLPAPEFSVTDDGKTLVLETAKYRLIYSYVSERRFTANSLVIEAKNNYSAYGASWRYGDRYYGDPPRHNNLFGTTRTLDRADGEVPLEFGLMDKSGHSFFDDDTALLEPDGSVSPRREGTLDTYYVCCAHEYRQTLADFYALSGRPPMLPRWALGNWWSRYWAYTDGEYLALLDRFQKEKLPFSVGVLDMDWHVTKVDPKYGKGWTGYTWNRELFPDPEKFLAQVHERGLHTALNLHPADGIQGCEEQYAAACRVMGTDPASDRAIPFDFTDETFRKAYFEALLHPLEKQGVDFWWIDWQQGRKCAVPGVDPLFLLNHYHHWDMGKNGLILSRFCGLGSQRYPVGFSGDTVASWASLRFQSYFTATAVNAGFPWWSHDIGGFMMGVRDRELAARWVQLGTFSPVLRLHSGKRVFSPKEPWVFGEAAPAIGKFLRLRHALIPYLYTALHRQHTEGAPIIEPLYYRSPEDVKTYPYRGTAYPDPRYRKCELRPENEVTNEYYFGGSLLVCPITAPADEITEHGRFEAYLPAGLYTDFETGKTYAGGRSVILNRPLSQCPVLACAGAIVPLAVQEGNATDNPAALEIRVFPGEGGSYTMYEDGENGASLLTAFRMENGQFTVTPEGDASCVPQKRRYTVVFRGFAPFTPTGSAVESSRYDEKTRSVIAVLRQTDAGEAITLGVSGAKREENADYKERIFDFLQGCTMELQRKEDAFAAVRSIADRAVLLEELYNQHLPARVLECLAEFLTR